MRILLIDDDATFVRFERHVLQEAGLAVDVASTLAEGRSQAFVNEYDAILLDLQLPDGNGIALIRELRLAGRDVPILMLTGSGGPGEEVLALDAGADDFLEKPFKIAALRARVRALIRRGGAKNSEQLTVGDLVLDRVKRVALVSGVPLGLTARELSLLEQLALHADEVVTRTELLEKVIEVAFDPGTNVVDVHVSRIRKKLRDADSSVVIESRRGVGFVLRTSIEARLESLLESDDES